MGLIKKYFNWLQKDTPSGLVEKYPAIDKYGETSVKGIYIIGDLTGIPLLKIAAESGKKIIDHLSRNEQFLKLRYNTNLNDVKDIIIVGAGPAGIAAGIESLKYGYNFNILEAAKKFNTIINFPNAKPILAEPIEYKQESTLIIKDGIKESLLEDLNSQIKNFELPIQENTVVERIEKKEDHFVISTSENEYKALVVILAIGKSGNFRQLNVIGETLPKVFNRLIDPAEAIGHNVLIIGGGDSALETAIAVSDYAESVTITYRKDQFSRAREKNLNEINSLNVKGKVKLLFNSNIKEVTESNVILSQNGKDISVKNSLVYTMIGKELPTDFLRRSKIKMEGELSITAKLQFLLLILIAGIIYFGKSSADFYSYLFGKTASWNDIISRSLSLEFWIKFLALPLEIIDIIFSDKLELWNSVKYINGLVAYFSFFAAVILGIYLLLKFIKDNTRQFKTDWNTFKHLYFIGIAIFFAVIFFGGRYFGIQLLGKSQSFFYTGLYSLTILIFGLRRIKVNPTRYIRIQTWTLILIQVFPLFILPEFIFPMLGNAGLLGGKEGFILTQVFPGNSYWRSYGFILAWPLFFSNLYGSNITSFWLVFSFFQTFIIIPYIVYRWGKGAYCGWICSCGALAETLGDEYRTLAIHGPKSKKLENLGQWILLAAFLITGLKLVSILYNVSVPILNESISLTADFFQKFYYIGIDVVFAGVLGVGVYFFLSGRVWCRFGCPLAAWMHIVNRFSRYRIFADKKKCISCNICTKVCHMGIDVMNYANKGIPMNDIQCVRCSACIINCPTEVLKFGSLPNKDTANILYTKIDVTGLDKQDWTSGL